MLETRYIKDYEGLYKITPTGVVYSVDRYNIDKNGKKKFYPERELYQSPQKRNHTTYKAVTLSKEGKAKRFLVHRLVAETYIPNLYNKPIVNHIDNNGENNRVENLEWCTHSENMLHAQKQGRLFKAQSNGGKVSSLIQEAKTREISDSYLGKSINNWKILTYAKPRIQKDGKNHKYVKAQCCLCMCVHEVYLSTIVTGLSKNCNACGKRLAIEKRTLNKSKNSIGKIFNNLKVISKSHIRPYDKLIAMNVECIICGNTLKKGLNDLINNKVSCRKTAACKGKDIV